MYCLGQLISANGHHQVNIIEDEKSKNMCPLYIVNTIDYRWIMLVSRRIKWLESATSVKTSQKEKACLTRCICSNPFICRLEGVMNDHPTNSQGTSKGRFAVERGSRTKGRPVPIFFGWRFFGLHVHMEMTRI